MPRLHNLLHPCITPWWAKVAAPDHHDEGRRKRPISYRSDWLAQNNHRQTGLSYRLPSFRSVPSTPFLALLHMPSIFSACNNCLGEIPQTQNKSLHLHLDYIYFIVLVRVIISVLVCVISSLVFLGEDLYEPPPPWYSSADSIIWGADIQSKLFLWIISKSNDRKKRVIFVFLREFIATDILLHTQLQSLPR